MNSLIKAKILLGRPSPLEIIQCITYLASNDHPLIKEIEQVIEFQVGYECFVELHIVIPGHISSEISYLIG
jgi:hypothetical protein